MSTTYAHAHVSIDCTLAQAKQIKTVLNTLEDKLPEWVVVPDLNDVSGAAIDWPLWSQNLLVALAHYLMEDEQEGFSFEAEMDLPLVDGRMVENEDQFRGLMLGGDQVSDDLFETAQQILKALASEQVISTGIAYTGDVVNEYTYSGNLVTITSQSWAYMINNEDVTAFEEEVAGNLAYWLVTYGPENAAHPNTFLWVAGFKQTANECAQAVIDQLAGQHLPENMETGDLTLTPIPGIAYRRLTKAMPLSIDFSLSAKSTNTDQESAA